MKHLNILIIDDFADDAELVALQLKADKIDFSWKHIDNEKRLREALKNNNWDAVISDYSMPGFDGLSALKIVKEWNEEVPFIMVSGTIGEDVAVNAMKKGAQDYLMKSRMKRLGQALLREIKDAKIKHQAKEFSLALAQRETEMQSILKTSPVGIGIIDENRKLQYVNERICEFSGYTKDELIGMNSKMFYVNDDDYERVGKETYFDIDKKDIGKTDFKLKRKDGKILDVQMNISMIPKSKKSNSFVITLTDVTERKKDEKIKSVLYNISNTAILSKDIPELMDLIRKELGRIMDTTNFFVALYDKNTDTLELPYYLDEKDYYSTFPAGKTMTAYVINTKKSILVKSDEIEKMEKSGIVETIGENSKIWLGVPLKVKENVIGVLVLQSYKDENAYSNDDLNTLEVISNEISISIERKKYEEELKSALKQAKESDKLKSTFLSTISHELRTPLNAIIGFSEIIDFNTPKEEIIEYVEMINKSGYSLFEIIEDILEITDIESGKIILEKTHVKVYPIFESLSNEIELLKEKESKKHLNTHLKLPYNIEDVTLNINAPRFRKIFIHLLRNAIKFTEKGNIEYGLFFEKEKIVFYVKDTGIGIPENKKDIIFDKFRQVDDSNTRQHGGLGIGLTYVKKIINIYKGEIWFDSDEKNGTTFYFSLPVSSEVESIKTVFDKKKLQGKTILVAEDEDLNYLLLEKMLSLEKVNIIRAVNGKETVTIFNKDKKHIDLILMDIKMPIMNGFEATTEIRKISDIPIFALSAYTTNNDIEKAYNCGCDEFIAKPIKRVLLLEKIAEFVDRE